MISKQYISEVKLVRVEEEWGVGVWWIWHHREGFSTGLLP